MKKKHLLKSFIAFLKKHGVYDEYMYQLYIGEQFRFYNINKELVNPISFIIQKIKHKPYELIIDAFDWSKTKYSIDVWWVINNEWFEYLKKKNINVYETKR